MEEIWRDIIIEKNGVTYDYSGLYEVSNYGRVRSLDRVDSNGHRLKGKIKKLRVNNMGYVCVGLCKDGKVKTFSVHRLVATAFIPNPKNLPVVNHRDENPSNNCVKNLEWCTQKYNTNYGTCQERRSEKIKGKKNPMYGRKGENHPTYGRKGEKSQNAKKVICLETKQIFGSIVDAKQWLGKGNINTCLAGKIKSAGGYHWMYLDDYKRQLRMNTDINNSRLIA